jgi:hypothetical protein
MKYHVEMENLGLTSSCILCKMRFPEWHDGNNMKNHLIKVHLGSEIVRNSGVFEDKASKETDLELVSHIALR